MTRDHALVFGLGALGLIVFGAGRVIFFVDQEHGNVPQVTLPSAALPYETLTSEPNLYATTSTPTVTSNTMPSPLPVSVLENISTEPSAARGGCYVSGCSNQLCSEEEGYLSTCEWQEEYACYQTAQCERQADGVCGWTETIELTQCVASTTSEAPLTFEGIQVQ